MLRNVRASRTGLMTLIGGASILALATAANAQTEAQPAPATSAGSSALTAQDVADVIVTGTRIVRPGYTAPTPITTVDAVQIAASGVSNIADLLNQVPAFRPTTTSTSSDQRTFAPGANYADLRGLGSTRTLVLINGERVVPEVPVYSSGITNQVDLNIIPTIAIQRTDVITGGASAAWGSDAVAGVVNVILYKHYQGFKAELSGGESEHEDNRAINASILAGTGFQDDRGHVTVAAEYDKNRGIGDIFTRSWGKDGRFTLANPACTGCYIAGSGYQYASVAPGGLITTVGPLKGTAFGPGGVPFAFQYGSFVNGAGMFGGGVPGNSPQAGVYIRAPTERFSFYGYADYALTDHLEAHIQVDLSQANANNHVTVPFTGTIASGNPYIPASIQAVMTANHIASFKLGLTSAEFGGPLREAVADQTKRVSAGLNWDIGQSWTADAYYQYGSNYDRQHLSNVQLTANVNQALNAVVSNGQIVCANPANNCAPLNPFGVGSASPAALNFISTDGFLKVRYVQQVAAANIHGDPFSTWAGPISVAAGVEYRDETQNDTSSPAIGPGKTTSVSNPSFRGHLAVSEVYGEAVVPLAKDLPWIKELDLNAAARYTHYSTIGGVKTWKVGATWNVDDELLLRATDSHDIRAPNLTELNFPTTQAGITAVSGQLTQANVFNGGNPNLKPEVASSLTTGFTYSPRYISGLHLTLDYFKIKLANAIAVANGANVLNQCAAGIASYCALETISGGVVTEIHTIFANLASVRTKGLDVEASYSTRLSRFVPDLPGSLTLRGLGTYTDSLTAQVGPGLPTYNRAGQVQGGLLNSSPYYAPTFRGSFLANYNLSRFSGTLVANYISSGVTDKTLTTANYAANKVPAYTKFDLLASYYLDSHRQLQVFGVINNLFNKSPPFDPSTTLTIPTNAALYDVIGRTFKVGIRFTR